MRVTRESTPTEPARDMELTGTLLAAVAAGHEAGVTRVFVPGPTLAFGRRDRLRAQFDTAQQIARDHGYVPVVRHGGGLAVAYDQNAVIIETIAPEDRVVGDLEQRFSQMAQRIQTILTGLGVDTELGELPGEYCPGRFSLHLAAGAKVVGMAQRIIRGASLTTAVISVGDPEPIRAVISDVYAALELPLDSATVGAVIDHHPDITPGAVADALLASVADGCI